MAGADGLRTGDMAPSFALPDHFGVLRRLGEFAGSQVVLFFYPRADTPSCTAQAQDFSARLADFEAANAIVIGVSSDSPRKLARFRERRGLSVMLLSDEAGGVLRAYGVWVQKSMYGRSFEGISRSTFLIGRDGEIAEIWPAVKVPGHAETVLKSVRKRA